MSWQTDISVWADKPDSIQVFSDDGREQDYVPERTCHETKVHKWWRGCDQCGYNWEFMYGIGEGKRPTYCPRCGAKVVE